MPSGTGLLKEIEITPVLDTNIYAAGDVLFVPTKLANVARMPGSNVALNSITAVDADDETTLDFDLVFARSEISMAAVNAPLSVNDADATEILSIVVFTTASHQIDLTTSRLYQQEGLAIQLQTAATSVDLWVGAILRGGTPTFATASDMMFRFGFTQD